MRKLLTLVFFLCLATVSKADLEAHSLQLFEQTQAAAADFLDVMDAMKTGAADGASQRLAQINRAASSAEATWWASFGSSSDSEPYARFMPCREAALALQDLSQKVAKRLDGAFAGSVDEDVRWFRQNYSACEIALGMEPSFPGEM